MLVRKYAIFLFMLILVGCAQHFTPAVFSDPYGFFSGVWHGMISPITLLVNIASLLLSLIGVSFLADIQIISRPNTVFGYYSGFFIGCIFLSGAGKR